MVQVKFILALADYIDGAKQYLIQALAAAFWIASRLHIIHLDEDLTLAAGLLVCGASGVARALTWKPGALSGAKIVHESEEGGAIVVKPDKELP